MAHRFPALRPLGNCAVIPCPRSTLHNLLGDLGVRPRPWVSGQDRQWVLLTFWSPLQGWQRWVFRRCTVLPQFWSLLTKKSVTTRKISQAVPWHSVSPDPRGCHADMLPQGLPCRHAACLLPSGAATRTCRCNLHRLLRGRAGWREKEVKKAQIKSLPALKVLMVWCAPSYP